MVEHRVPQTQPAGEHRHQLDVRVLQVVGSPRVQGDFRMVAVIRAGADGQDLRGGGGAGDAQLLHRHPGRQVAQLRGPQRVLPGGQGRGDPREQAVPRPDRIHRSGDGQAGDLPAALPVVDQAAELPAAQEQRPVPAAVQLLGQRPGSLQPIAARREADQAGGFPLVQLAHCAVKLRAVAAAVHHDGQAQMAADELDQAGAQLGGVDAVLQLLVHHQDVQLPCGPFQTSQQRFRGFRGQLVEIAVVDAPTLLLTLVGLGVGGGLPGLPLQEQPAHVDLLLLQ